MEKLTDIAKEAIEKIEERGFSAYLVGGAVRDRLMKNEIHDIDITTSALPKEIEEIFSENQVIEAGLKHGTLTVLFKKTPVEITTFRTEGDYSDNRHPDKVAFTDSIVSDLSRRDFTMNAVALGSGGEYVDPFFGTDDIQRKLIRSVGDPNRRFREDSLRILRALRFSSVFGFEIEEKTKEAVFEEKELLKNLSAERVSSELSKLLCGENAGEVLLEFGEVFGVVLPCLGDMLGFEQHNEHHCFDVYEHTVNVVKNVRPDLHMRLAALFHDCAKPLCLTFDEKKTGHFYSHASKGADIARSELTRLRFDADTVNRVEKLVRIHDSPIEPDEKTVKRKLGRLGEDTFFDLVELQRADNLAQAEEFKFRQKTFDALVALGKKALEENACFSVKSLAVNGYDIMNLGLHGKAVGKALDFLLEAVIEEKIPNEKGALLSAVKSKKEEFQMSNLKIRKLRKDDHDVFVEMGKEFYSSEAVLHSIDEGCHEAAFEELMRSDIYLECFIFEIDSKTAGYALLDKMYSREVGGLVVWVEELYVRSEFRCHGIGNSFFNYLEKNVPATRYRLEIEPDNLRARALYERRGYKILGYSQMYKDVQN